MLIYIHGFNSSPASYKANLLKQYAESAGIAERLLIPELSAVPAKAIAQLRQLIEQSLRSKNIRSGCPVSLIGSSLGGYYATFLAETYDCRVVLINPVVNPYILLEEALGPNKNYYTGEEYEITAEHIEQLRAIEIETITHPDRYLLMLQTGDEVLDYTLAMEKYAAVPSIVEEGGSHEFMGFDRHLETVLAFCGINCLKNYS
ncbi:MAG: esterase [Gammaproteobacteria bacterium]|nr:esterase [Gammaproteobacteria bacterium]